MSEVELLHDSVTNADVADVSECGEVCLSAPRDTKIALVPCGHARFCIISPALIQITIRDADVQSADNRSP